MSLRSPEATSTWIVCTRRWMRLGAPRVFERTEKELIAVFCDKIAELKPQLVTFNGNSFDLPVLGRGVIHTHIHQKTENTHKAHS